jgi:hypothetical protein
MNAVKGKAHDAQFVMNTIRCLSRYALTITRVCVAFDAGILGASLDKPPVGCRLRFSHLSLKQVTTATGEARSGP